MVSSGRRGSAGWAWHLGLGAAYQSPGVAGVVVRRYMSRRGVTRQATLGWVLCRFVMEHQGMAGKATHGSFGLGMTGQARRYKACLGLLVRAGQARRCWAGYDTAGRHWSVLRVARPGAAVRARQNWLVRLGLVRHGRRGCARCVSSVGAGCELGTHWARQARSGRHRMSCLGIARQA